MRKEWIGVHPPDPPHPYSPSVLDARMQRQRRAIIFERRWTIN